MKIQILETSNEFQVLVNRKPVYTCLFSDNSANKALKQMEAESAAYSYILANQSADCQFKICKMKIK